MIISEILLTKVKLIDHFILNYHIKFYVQKQWLYEPCGLVFDKHTFPKLKLLFQTILKRKPTQF